MNKKMMLLISIIIQIVALSGMTESEPTRNSRVLIAYFSQPTDVDTSDLDAVSSASVVVRNQMPESSNDTVAGAIADPRNQQTLYLWEENYMPAITEYTENNGYYADDPDFRPYMVAFPRRHFRFRRC
ncbi:MAG: hypothetical protein K2J99_12080 [Lachnospiraceae bacterium]|nr:hypothetical protein [Lachnospiraceae bacterium]